MEEIKKAFVLMPFSEPVNSYYEAIFKPALEAAGYEAIRADDIFLPRPIMDDIWEQINYSDLILCEMTGRNPNVFYELGLAHALRKPVILVSRNEGDIPFDLRHLRIIVYDTNHAYWAENLKERISKTAEATNSLTEVRFLPNLEQVENSASSNFESEIVPSIPKHSDSEMAEEQARARLRELSKPYTEAAFLVSVRLGQLEAVEVFLAAGMSPDTKDGEGNTALALSIKANHPEVSNALISAGADLNAVDKEGDSVLLLATKSGSTEATKSLILEGADVNYKGSRGSTSLMCAASNGDMESVHDLIEAGADVDAKNNSSSTALMSAAYGGHPETVRILIEAGSDVNARDIGSWTALAIASRWGRTETVRKLIEAGADVNASFKSGRTPLMQAAYNGHTETVLALIDAGADVTAHDNQGDTALSDARVRGHADIVQLLRDAGAT